MYVWQRHIVVETLMIYASELETAMRRSPLPTTNQIDDLRQLYRSIRMVLTEPDPIGEHLAPVVAA